MSREDWKILIRRYADGRPICNCGEAYYSVASDGTQHCPGGCSANVLHARDDIAKQILDDFEIKGGKQDEKKMGYYHHIVGFFRRRRRLRGSL